MLCCIPLYLAPIKSMGKATMYRRIISVLKHCVINSYFPFKKADLFCCLFWMQGS